MLGEVKEIFIGDGVGLGLSCDTTTCPEILAPRTSFSTTLTVEGWQEGELPSRVAGWMGMLHC